MGMAQGMQFENWMYYFIDETENGKRKFDWAKIIGENLELPLRTVQNQSNSTWGPIFSRTGCTILLIKLKMERECLIGLEL